MIKGRHAATRGPSARTANTSAFRGAALLLIAVLIGILLLNVIDDSTEIATVKGESLVKEDAAGTNPTSTTSTTALAPPRSPAQIKVLVANGSSIKGAGSKVSDDLKALGYNTLQATNTSSETGTSTVYFTPGFDREATTIGMATRIPATQVRPLTNPGPVPDPRDANVLVVIGADLAVAPATTTTTKPAGATTTVKG